MRFLLGKGGTSVNGMTPELHPRLQMLKSLIPQGVRLADVGTDHGYIPVSLLLEGKIASAIASDIAEAPLRHAGQTAERYGVSEGITFRLSAGLEGFLPGEANCFLLAGMGGETIRDILAEATWLLREDVLLILQPQTKQELLRKWLSENGYVIVKEYLVSDRDALYNIFTVRVGKSVPLSDFACYAGVHLSDDPLYAEYLQRQAERLDKTVIGLRRSDREENLRRADELEDLRNALRKGEEL